jgi:hypothetical protein
MDFGVLFKRAGKVAADNSPAILSAIGITGTLATVYLAAKGGFKAAKVLDEAAETKKDKLTTRETFDATWKLYVPAATSAALTVASIVCSVQISERRTAALAGAYSIAEKSYTEYRKKTSDTVGKKKEQEIRDKIAQDKVTANTTNLIVTNKGETRCYDTWTDRDFISDMESLRKAVNDLNERIINENYASLSDFYNLIGLNSTAESDYVGWNTNQLLEVDYSGVLDKHGAPMIALTFRNTPMSRFSSLY